MNPLNGLSLSSLLLKWPEAAPAQKAELIANWAKAPAERALLAAPIDEKTLDRALVQLLLKPAPAAQRLWFAALALPDRQPLNPALVLPRLEHLIAQNAKENLQTLSEPIRRYAAAENAALRSVVLETPAETKERLPGVLFSAYAAGAEGFGEPNGEGAWQPARLLMLLKMLRDRLARWKRFFETHEGEAYEGRPVADLLAFCTDSLARLDRLIALMR
ncbi:MAG: hypothetical protein AB7E49_06360 [Campylobacterales bacterium]